MAGKFSPNSLPKRPGAYFRFVAREAEPIFADSQNTVVVPFTHSWGPAEEVVQLNSFGDFLEIYGQGGTTPPDYSPGYQAVHDAFRGEGVEGFGGAGTVLAFRQIGADAAKSTKALSNTTPATAITLQGIYHGSYGNKLSVGVTPNALDPTNTHDLVLYVEDAEAERYEYAKTNITDLAAQINGTGAYVGRGSDWVRTTGAVTSGVVLATVSTPESFTGGNDGSTLLAADWTALMTAAEPHRFSLFAAQALTDSSILASLKAWAQNLNVKGKRFITVVGGGTDGTPDSMSIARARSATLDDPDFVNVGGGLYTDDKFGDLHPARLVSRVAGILAQRGQSMSITFARLAGLEIKTGVSEAEILQAISGGVVAISRDSNAIAPVRLELGVTTFTTKTDEDRPVEIYSVPKYIRTMHSIETELTEFAEGQVIGKMPVNDGTRDYLRGQMEARLAVREETDVILGGWSVRVSQNPPPSDTDTFISLDYEITFARSLDAVLNTVTVG